MALGGDGEGHRRDEASRHDVRGRVSMTGYAAPIQRLIQELGRLPGIGEKTATRLAMFILRWSPEEAKRLAESIVDVKEKIRFCSVCFNLAEGRAVRRLRRPGPGPGADLRCREP
ncbi:MAG: hypothetical protein MZW92_17175 [Comamonadaceae bacterium]|nr:hypothetical protein [Comamonadaceae bacterium]